MTVVSRVESAGTTSTGLFGWLREGTPTARRGLLAASLGWMLDGFDIMLYALVIGALLRDFSISTATAGLLGLLTLVASGIGGVLFGAIADRFGRRRAMIGSILVYSIFTAACGLAQTVWQLGIFRFLLGLGMGGEWTSGAALVSETWPDRHRGKAVALMQSAWAVGYAAAAIVVALVLPRFGWRVVFLIGILPALLTLWIRHGVHESDVWLRSRTAPPESRTPVREVFSGRYASSTALLTFLSLTTIFAYWGLNLWVPAYLSLPQTRGGLGFSTSLTTLLVVTMQVGTFFGYVSFGYVSDAFGRRRSFVAVHPHGRWPHSRLRQHAKCPLAARARTARGLFRDRLLLGIRGGDSRDLPDFSSGHRAGLHVQCWSSWQRGRPVRRRLAGADAWLRDGVRTPGRCAGVGCDDLDLVAGNTRAKPRLISPALADRSSDRPRRRAPSGA